MAVNSWSELFIREGGYAALLASLTELLNVEWRLVHFYSL